MCTFGPDDELKDARAFWARYKTGTPRSDDVALRVHQELREGSVFRLLTKAKKNPSRAFISGPLRDVCKLLTFLAFDPDSAQLTVVKAWAAALLDFAFTQPSIEAVVTSAFFAELLQAEPSTAKRRKANALSNCAICGQIAAQCYEHAPSYRFCSFSGCAQSMGPIGFILT